MHTLGRVHVQSKYAIDLAEARRVVAEHGWARVVTVGDTGLRATYGFFLLEDSAEREQVVGAGVEVAYDGLEVEL